MRSSRVLVLAIDVMFVCKLYCYEWTILISVMTYVYGDGRLGAAHDNVGEWGRKKTIIDGRFLWWEFYIQWMLLCSLSDAREGHEGFGLCIAVELGSRRTTREVEKI